MSGGKGDFGPIKTEREKFREGKVFITDECPDIDM